MIQEFADCQLLLIQQLFDVESTQSGFVGKALGSVEKIENILDYCMNVYEIIKNDKKLVSVKYLLIQYYVLSQQSHKLPDLGTIKKYAYEVFSYVQ